MCVDWPDSLWVAVEKAETAAARKRAQRAQRSLLKPTLSVSSPRTEGSVLSTENTALLVSLRDTLAKLAPVFSQAGVPLAGLGGTESGAAIARLPPDSRHTPSSDRPRRDPTPSGPVALDLTLIPSQLSEREDRPMSGFPDPPRITRRGVWDRPGPAATAGSRGFSPGSGRTPAVAGIRPCHWPAQPPRWLGLYPVYERNVRHRPPQAGGSGMLLSMIRRPGHRPPTAEGLRVARFFHCLLAWMTMGV